MMSGAISIMCSANTSKTTHNIKNITSNSGSNDRLSFTGSSLTLNAKRNSTPEARPHATLLATPNITPHVTLLAVPQSKAQAKPDATPTVKPKTTPTATPDVTLNKTFKN